MMSLVGKTLVSNNSVLQEVRYKSFGGQLIISVISSIQMGGLCIVLTFKLEELSKSCGGIHATYIVRFEIQSKALLFI